MRKLAPELTGTESSRGEADQIAAAIERREDVPAILRGAMLSFGANGGGVLAAYLLQILMARWMGAGPYGAYVYLCSWAAFLAVPATLGLPAALVRFIPQYQSQRDAGRMYGILQFSLLAASVASATVALVGSWLCWTLRRSGPGSPVDWLFALWTMPAMALVALLTEALRASGRVLPAYAPSQLARPAILACAALGMVCLRGRLDLLAALAATLGSFILTVLLQRECLRRVMPTLLPLVPPTWDARAWLEVAAPLGGAATLGAIFDHAPTVIVGLLLTPADVGIYYVAARSAALVTSVITAVNALAAPAFASIHWRGDRAGLERLVAKLAHYIFWPSLAVASAIAIFSRPILSFFGAPFAAGRPIILILLAGQLINAGTGSVGYLLQMTGHQLAILQVLVVTAAVSVTLGVILTRWYGGIGAALAAAVTTILWNLWLHRLVTERLAVRSSIVEVIAQSLGTPEKA